MTLWLVKALQGSEPGAGPEKGSGGWQPSVNDATQLVKFPAEVTIWNDVSPSQRISLMEGYLRIWLAKIRTFTPQQFYAGGWADPTVALIPGAEGSFGDRIANMIPQYLYQGVDPALIDQIVAWAKTVWPGFNWSSVRNATCFRSGVGLAVACH